MLSSDESVRSVKFRDRRQTEVRRLLVNTNSICGDKIRSPGWLHGHKGSGLFRCHFIAKMDSQNDNGMNENGI